MTWLQHDTRLESLDGSRSRGSGLEETEREGETLGLFLPHLPVND